MPWARPMFALLSSPRVLLMLGGALLLLAIGWTAWRDHRLELARRADSRFAMKLLVHRLVVWLLALVACALPWFAISQMGLGQSRDSARLLSVVWMPIWVLMVLVLAKVLHGLTKPRRPPSVGQIARQNAAREMER